MNGKLLKAGVCLLCCATVTAGAAFAFGGEGALTAGADSGTTERAAPAVREDDSSAAVRKCPKGKDRKFDLGLDLSKYKNMAPEEAKTALLADAKAVLDAKVADGSLTREQADRIYQRIAETPERGIAPGDCYGLGLDMEKYKGMKPEEAKTALLADAKAALDAKVADGSLTQERADEILKKVEDMSHFRQERKHRDGHGGEKASPKPAGSV